MAAPPIPPIPEPTPDRSAIGAMIREELDRNVGLAQRQIGVYQESFKYQYTIAATFIAIMAGVAIYLTYSNMTQMRSEMRAEAEQELKNVRVAVQNQIASEFQTENMQKTLRSVASERLTPIIREQVASALKENRAQLETAYQNVNNLVKEYQRKSDEINDKLRRLGPWELTQQEKDKLITGLKALSPMGIVITSHASNESNNFAEGFVATFKQSGWQTFYTPNVMGGGGSGIYCSWKEGDSKGEQVAKLIKASVSSATIQPTTSQLTKPTGATVETVINCLVTGKPLVK